jgi:hypothetical protein
MRRSQNTPGPAVGQVASRHVSTFRPSRGGILDRMSRPDAWDPGSPRNRERTWESQRQVRLLLMEWDPIGVAGVPEAADEYDCMISPLMHRLFDGADTGSLATWISHERSSHFGLGPDDDQDQQLADQLTAWWERRRTATS